MLLKVEFVEEIGRFASLKHKAPQFGRLSLIYARNGYGKSTLCSIIRSASEQNELLISARRRLGAVKESRVQTVWQSAGAVVFSSGRWNSSPGHIYVFDAEYIRRNVHVGEGVTRENKRNLIPVVLGAVGVQLAEKIALLDTEQRECSNKQNVVEKIIRAACPSVTDVKAFVEAEIPAEIDNKIVSAQRSLELARQAAAVKMKKDPTQIVLRPLSAFAEIACRSLDDVSEKASTLVKEHVNAHSMHPNGERWLKYGVDHMVDAKCPFCMQDTSSIDIVSIFKGYFSAEYAALNEDAEAALREITEIYGEQGERLSSLIKENDSDFSFWKNVCDIGAPPLVNDDEIGSIKQGLKLLKSPSGEFLNRMNHM